MGSLLCAGAFFVGIHVLISGTRLRGALVGVLGEQPYRGLFSLLSLGGIVWLCRAWAQAPVVPLWGPFDGLRPAALGLAAVAFVLVVTGLTTPSPTSIGGETLLARDEPARGILRVTRHPFLWGVAIWAAVHVALNGDAASVVLFGTLLILALIGPRLIDARRAQASGAEWARFMAVTSSTPFAAILQGRNTLHVREVGWWRLALGLAAFAGVLTQHLRLFGVSPYPR